MVGMVPYTSSISPFEEELNELNAASQCNTVTNTYRTPALRGLTAVGIFLHRAVVTQTSVDKRKGFPLVAFT